MVKIRAAVEMPSSSRRPYRWIVRLIPALLLIAAGFSPQFLLAHSGRLDASGCHHDRKTGDYHCHRSQSQSASSSSSSTLNSGLTQTSNSDTPSSLNRGTERFVTRAIDGDTIELSDGERVRLIGVDTPETVHPNRPVEAFGKEASAFTKREIEGREVRLEYDWQRKDKYGRTLAYVYRIPDGFFLNGEIIKQGYGHAYTRFSFKLMEEFRQYEREARENKRGLWK